MTWLHVRPGESPLILAFPHGGTVLPASFEAGFCSPRITLQDTDWPPPYDPEFAVPLRADLARILDACLAFAEGQP